MVPSNQSVWLAHCVHVGHRCYDTVSMASENQTTTDRPTRTAARVFLQVDNIQRAHNKRRVQSDGYTFVR